MKNKTNNKKNFLSKLFIKIIRKFGYEVIDQANLKLQSSNLYANENLSKSGSKSITVPLGTTNITNKINSLTIIIRSYTFGDTEEDKVMLDQNKKRIFELPKIEYTLRTIKSIIVSSEKSLEHFKDLKINIIITDDKSNSINLDRINKLLNSTKIDTKIINLDEKEFVRQINLRDVNGKEISKNMISNMKNILKSIEISENNNSDLFYFLEDDYIHAKHAITEMLFTYEKLSSQLNKELFLCPADYPFLYSNINDSKIFFGNMSHWRTVRETLITFMTSKKMINKYLDELKTMGQLRHHPMEQKLHQIYEQEYCLSPIPSLAMHTTNINSIYGLPPNFDWKKIWNENDPMN
ncbi:glycosyltransferase family 2 protein [Candidatus Pelagibacter sp.]|nr:glycosyltransferase family 2 protein [Candidatus Pelagibacter sp.]